MIFLILSAIFPCQHLITSFILLCSCLACKDCLVVWRIQGFELFKGILWLALICGFWWSSGLPCEQLLNSTDYEEAKGRMISDSKGLLRLEQSHMFLKLTEEWRELGMST